MRRPFHGFVILCLFLFSPCLAADDLTAMVQKDLVKLGYEPGNTRGELDTVTIVAISKFQAENDLEVTGEVSPQLAGVLQARIETSQTGDGTGQGKDNSAATAPAVLSHEELRAAQEACLQEKIQAKKESEQKKRGVKSLLRAAARVAGATGNYDLYKVSSSVYAADATASDLSRAAEDLGLSEDEVEECRNHTS